MLQKLAWAAVGTLGVAAMAVMALANGETVNAAWLVIAALCTYFIAYRFYALFIARTVLGVDASRHTDDLHKRPRYAWTAQ
jgi:carbon starvation protein